VGGLLLTILPPWQMKRGWKAKAATLPLNIGDFHGFSVFDSGA